MSLPISVQTAHRLAPLARVSCGFITALAWSPDGSMLALAHGSGVWLWEGGFGGEPSLRLEAHGAPVKGIAFSPDSRLLASASSDTTVRLWDSATGQSVLVISTHSDAVNAVAFSLDGRLLASAGGDRRVQVTDLTDSARSFGLAGHSGEITSLIFAEDMLASGGWDKSLRLWDYAGRHERVVIPFGGWIRDLAASPDSRTIAAACKDGTVSLIDAASGEVIRAFHTHEGGADCVAFSPDGALLATGGRDNRIRLWGLQHVADAPLAELSGHSKPVLALAFHPGGMFLASGSGDNSVRLWGLPG